MEELRHKMFFSLGFAAFVIAVVSLTALFGSPSASQASFGIFSNVKTIKPLILPAQEATFLPHRCTTFPHNFVRFSSCS